MATSYRRLRMFWGALDIETAEAETPGYGPTQIVSGGDAATIGSGVGVRRASLEFDRTALSALLDPVYCHFDFLNTTGGDPDDTWISSDFTTLETILQTLTTTMKPFTSSQVKLARIIWHRVGTGVGKPNPAERAFTLATPNAGSYSSFALAQQSACSMTFRTGVRKSWGRTYWPFALAFGAGTAYITSSYVDQITTALDVMVKAAATADFHLVVVSKPLSSTLNVEAVEVDDVVDVIRRRRPKKSTYKKIINS